MVIATLCLGNGSSEPSLLTNAVSTYNALSEYTPQVPTGQVKSGHFVFFFKVR